MMIVMSWTIDGYYHEFKLKEYNKSDMLDIYLFDIQVN